MYSTLGTKTTKTPVARQRNSNELVIGSWNTWSGCLADTLDHEEAVVEYTTDLVRNCDLLGLYEVHRPRQEIDVRFVQPRAPKGRPGRIDVELLKRVERVVADTHSMEFVAHFGTTALHDCEATDLPVDYGNALFVRHSLLQRPYSFALDRFVVYGDGSLNSEDSTTLKGRTASRKGMVATVQIGKEAVTIAFVHGLWTKKGKVDIPARTAQSACIAQGILHHRKRLNLNPKSGNILILGDLNYTSDLEAMAYLLHNEDAFGVGGGVNLTPHIDSRTKWYPEDKPTREANFVLASAPAAEKISTTHVENEEVPSDHGYTMTIYTIAPGIP
ncbi:hypothetical protein K2P47_00345 [Patescibacteria group bacterium]|nr:hypothetical protein [Patescibacteria group bacterium]